MRTVPERFGELYKLALQHGRIDQITGSEVADLVCDLKAKLDILRYVHKDINAEAFLKRAHKE